MEMNEENFKKLQEQITEKESMLSEARKESAQRRQALKEFDGVDVSEYNELKKSIESTKQSKLEADGKFEEAKNAIISAKDAEIAKVIEDNKKLKGKLKNTTITNRVKDKALELGAVNPKSVAILLREEIVMNDTGEIEVIDENGKTIFNEKGNPLSVDERVESFLNDNKYLIKGVESGSSSAGGEHKRNSDTQLSALDRIQRGMKNLNN
jgi:hypothetical protein